MFKFFLLVLLLMKCNGLPQNQGTGNQQSGNEWGAAWGNLKAAFRNVGDWFTRQYRTVQSWFGNSRQELETKVQDMIRFLDIVKNNATAIAQGAGQQLVAPLQKVPTYYNDVVQFQNKLRTDTVASFQSLQQEWQRKVQSMYNGGLDKIVEAAQAAKADGGQGQSTGGQSSSGQSTGGNTTA